MSPKELRDEAARLRERAAEIDDTNPSAADYHRHRANWCEYLARQREMDDEAAAAQAARRR